MNERENALCHGKQEDIAHGCAITVVTEPHFVVQRGLITKTLRRTFPAVCASPAGDTRYDLLSAPGLDEIVDDNIRLELLVEDILTAVSLHQAEYLTVIAEEGTQARLLDRLSLVPDLSSLIMNGCRVPSPKTVGGGLLALTCMDWRLHGYGGFLQELHRTTGQRVGGVMTIPGAAKDLTACTVRGRLAAAALYDLVGSGFRQVIIVSHTDCGKYGGHAGFAGADEENERLIGDLRQTAAFLRTHVEAEISLGLAEIGDCRTQRIIRVPAAEAENVSVF